MNTGKNGLSSGFHPVNAILTGPPTWSFRINDTLPIFYYCSAPGSCINYGMVGVINPNANVSLEKQVQLAKDSKYMLQPGDKFPTERISSISPSPASTTVSPMTTGTSTASSSSSSSTNYHSSLSSAAVAGLSIAVVILVILAAALCFFIGRNKSLKEQVRLKSIQTGMAIPELPGTMSPPSLPATMHYSDTYQGGETVYIPVKTSDLHRAYSQTRSISQGYANPAAAIGVAIGGQYEVGRADENQPQIR
jgi:hypothetical protein